LRFAIVIEPLRADGVPARLLDLKLLAEVSFFNMGLPRLQNYWLAAAATPNSSFPLPATLFPVRAISTLDYCAIGR
jgi:hypothetical protein